MVSVRLGARETMRRTGCGILTLRPVSSLTSRKAGGSVGEARAALCARDGAAAQEKTTRVAQARTARRDGGNFLKQFPTILARILPPSRLAVLARSEEHTSELQSRGHLVCRLLLEKKKEKKRMLLALAT